MAVAIRACDDAPTGKALVSFLTQFTTILVGIVLVIAASMKLHSSVRPGVFPSENRREFGRVTIPLTLAELVLGAMMLSGLWRVAARKAGIVAFVAFASVAAAKALIGQKNCGCFGAIPVSPSFTAVFDSCAVIGLWFFKPRVEDTRFRSCNLTRMIGFVAVILAAVTIATAWESRQPVVVKGEIEGSISAVDRFGAPGSLVMLEPATWSSKRFSLVSHIDTGSKLTVGLWVVILAHHDCDHCVTAIPRYEALAAQSRTMRLAIIEMPPYAQPGEELPMTPEVSLVGKLDTTRDWFAITPVAIYLKDGIVQAAADGDKAETPDPSWK